MTTSPPSGRKRPWYVRPLRFTSQTFSVKGYASDAEGGFQRQVVVNLTMDEPGKGGADTPQRPLILRLNPADAVRAATAMIVRAQEALAQNREHQDGGGYTNHWPDESTTPSADTGYMSPRYAADTEALVLAALERVTNWQAANPQVTDYRVTVAEQTLARAGRMLSQLKGGATPDLDAARAQREASGFSTETTPAPQVGATGHYRYYDTEHGTIPVTVIEVHGSHLIARLDGSNATIQIGALRYDRLSLTPPDPAARPPARPEKAIFATNRAPKVGATGQYYGTGTEIDVTVRAVYEDEVALGLNGTGQTIMVPRTDDDLRKLALREDDWEIR